MHITHTDTHTPTHAHMHECMHARARTHGYSCSTHVNHTTAGSGRKKAVCVKNYQPSEIHTALNWLKDSHGRGQVRRVWGVARVRGGLPHCARPSPLDTGSCPGCAASIVRWGQGAPPKQALACACCQSGAPGPWLEPGSWLCTPPRHPLLPFHPTAASCAH